MAQIHGRNLKIVVYDSGGTCRFINGDLNDMTLKWDRDNPESTTFGNDTVQRIAGLRDASLDLAGIYNSGGNNVDTTLTGIMAASLNTLVLFTSASVSGCPVYSACMLISSYEMSGNLSGPVGVKTTFQISSGSLTAACVA